MQPRFLSILLLFLALLLPVASADFNPKSISNIEVKIIKSGTIYVTGDLNILNLSLYIPQEGIKNIEATPDWNYKEDTFGNKMIVLGWEKPWGRIDYNIEMVVENSAKHFKQKKPIGENPFYLKETETIDFTDAIRKLAYPYEKTLDRVAELTIIVHDMVEYDSSVAGQDKPSSWVMENRRGVCVEYDNLLTSLLRISGIPTRYVVGYAYSSLDKKFLGHSWVEVLVKENNAENQGDAQSASGSSALGSSSGDEWVAFDPTWLQGGYLDATHIKTANLLDNNQTETLYYIGRGSALWEKNDDVVEIIYYTTSNITDISLFSDEYAQNGGGYLKADLASNECSIADVTASSCVDNERNKMLNIYEDEREVWFCDSAEVYWVFDIAESETTYTCPVLVYDQMGSEGVDNIKISRKKQVDDVFISGPDSVGVNEPFTLEAVVSDGFIFFSPKFGKSNRKLWKLSTGIPGSYNFYLYSENAIAKKTIKVIEKKEFSLFVDAPDNVTTGSFLVNVTVKNLLDENKPATVRIEFDSQIQEKMLSFQPGESKTIQFNLTTASPGLKKLSASAMSDSISSYSTSLLVLEEESSDIIGIILTFFGSIIDAIAGLFE